MQPAASGRRLEFGDQCVQSREHQFRDAVTVLDQPQRLAVALQEVVDGVIRERGHGGAA